MNGFLIYKVLVLLNLWKHPGHFVKNPLSELGFNFARIVNNGLEKKMSYSFNGDEMYENGQ